MKFFRNKFILKFLSFLSISILLLNIANKSVYLHSHQLENGEIVTHAHPFNQQQDHNPLKSHKHSNLEYLLLSAINIFNLAIIVFSLVVFKLITTTKFYFSKTCFKQLYFHYKQNKSPPVLNSI